MDIMEEAEEACDEFSSLNDMSSPARKRVREDTSVYSARLSPAKNGSSCFSEVTVKTELINAYVGISSEEKPDQYYARFSPAKDGSSCLDKVKVKTEPIDAYVGCSSEVKLDQVTAKEELIYKEEELIPDFTVEVENEKVSPTDVCRDQVIDPLGVSSVEIPHSSTKQKVPRQYTHRFSKQSSRHIQPNVQGIFQSKAASAEEYLNTQEPVIDKVQENRMSHERGSQVKTGDGPPDVQPDCQAVEDTLPVLPPKMCEPIDTDIGDDEPLPLDMDSTKKLGSIERAEKYRAKKREKIEARLQQMRESQRKRYKEKRDEILEKSRDRYCHKTKGTVVTRASVENHKRQKKRVQITTESRKRVCEKRTQEQNLNRERVKRCRNKPVETAKVAPSEKQVHSKDRKTVSRILS